MLVWLEGSLNPNEIKDHVLKDGDIEFRDKLLAFLDDTISNSIPPDPLQVIGQVEHHPCAVRGVSFAIDDMENYLRKNERQSDLHRLVKQCQQHIHSQTCYKYWKGPLSREPRECRFDLDEKNFCPNSYFDNETGELNLQCLDARMVNNFNLTIIEAIRCNMDVKFIGSGPLAKAVLYYITDYITKSQLKSHVAFAALELAVKKLGEHNEEQDEATTRAKWLLQKCAFAMISHQELSSQQVCSYLMGQGDHYTSHEFRNLYWTAFERFIDNEDPSPKCHSRSSLKHDNLHETIPGNENEQDEFEQDGGQPSNKPDEVEIDTDCDVTNLDNDEVIIAVQQNGKLIAKTNQVLDYQQRSPFLDNLCLWDMMAQIDKVRRRKKAQDNLDDNVDSDCDANTNIEDSDEENHQSSDDILASSTRIRPTYDLSSEHPNKHTHCQKIRQTQKQFVPVPIGPLIPRRDRDELKERYCRLMLIMFKPWRHAQHLRMTGKSWSSAFQSFIERCPPQKKRIMDNMQILHECRDSRDNHFIQRRNRNRNKVNPIAAGITKQT
jgi:hypothetical protein